MKAKLKHRVLLLRELAIAAVPREVCELALAHVNSIRAAAARPFIDAVDVLTGTCPQVAAQVRTGLAEVALPAAVASIFVPGDAELEALG